MKVVRRNGMLEQQQTNKQTKHTQQKGDNSWYSRNQCWFAFVLWAVFFFFSVFFDTDVI